MTQPVRVAFYHGLGDCANFAPQVALYRRRGIDVVVVCDSSKRPVFEALGIPTELAGDANTDVKRHPWWEPNRRRELAGAEILAENKSKRNFCASPLPPAPDSPEALWDEYVNTRDPTAFATYADNIKSVVADLPRPLVLIHGQGNTSQAEKNMPANLAYDFAEKFLSKSCGSVIFLDWDHRTPWFHSARTRNILYHYKGALQTTEALMGLIGLADLIIGVDSGPFHLAGVIDAPSIGLWFEHHPATYAVPRKNCLNIAAKARPINETAGHLFNIVHQPNITADYLTEAAQMMLLRFSRWFPGKCAADTQLQLCVNKCSGGIAAHPHASKILVDRHMGFNAMFDELAAKQRSVNIVETGCIRADNDWAGAGYSTFLFGLFVERAGGKMLSIDIDRHNCEYARRVCHNLRGVSVQCDDSLQALRQITEPVDLFYLDSMDTHVPQHADHALAEAKICVDKVSPGGLIVFDDTLYEGDMCSGKGAKAVPWLISQGWRVLFAGYQVVLTR